MKAKGKLLLIISILAIASSVSYAYYEAVVHGTGNNNMEGSAHTATIEDLILTGTTEVVNTNMIPGESSEYSFTIENPNSFPVCFGLYFENITNTFVNKSDLEVSLNGEVGIFPATGDTSTIIGGFKAKANSTTAYTLTVTYKDVIGKDQTSDIGKSFSGTIKARTTECGLEQSQKTLARLNLEVSNSDKCLQTDENGMILNPDSTMSDSDTPIICSMEDDYGTSYYLRGNHQDNNVKFANMCWKLVRVTGTGGLKLIYNGDLDENGKCTTTSGKHSGFSGQTLSLSGNKVYGTRYTYDGSAYTLTDTSTMNFSTDSSSIIGKYTCGDTSTSCTNPYYVVSKENDTTGYVLKMGVSTNYAAIGTSTFNSSYNSPSYVGYMYNDVYAYQSKTMATSTTILLSQSSSSSNFYYGDIISYSGGQYYIRNQDGSNVTQLSWADNYTSLPGKYTCRSTSKYNDTTIRCTMAFKVLDTTTKANYMIAEYLSGGRTSVGTIKLSNGYTDNGDGTYTLNSPVTEKSAMEWYNGYSSFKNYYVCEDYNQTACNKLYKITSASQTYIVEEIGVFNNYYYGESFTYNNGTYTLNNTVQFFDINDSTNKTSLNTHHYTCFNATGNTCSEMYYIYYLSGITPYYIKLNGNETGPEALNKMVSNNDINVKDSTIKKFIDGWYSMNLKGTEYESKLEDTVFCNDRTINQLNGWSETGSLSGYLYFNGGQNKYYLKCPNKRDAFTVSDIEKGNSVLTYPVGLLTTAEHSLIGNKAANKTNAPYWSSAPACFNYYYGAYGHSVDTSGYWWYNRSVSTSGDGVHPSISLKPNITFKSGGDGSASNPFEVE